MGESFLPARLFSFARLLPPPLNHRLQIHVLVVFQCGCECNDCENCYNDDSRLVPILSKIDRKSVHQ